MVFKTQDVINSTFGTGTGDAGALECGAIVGAHDFANIAQAPAEQNYVPNFSQNILRNNGLVELRERIAPTARLTLDVNATYQYKFYPTKESILAVKNPEDFKRGFGGEFPYVGNNYNLQAAKLDNVGVSIVIEKELARKDPTYRANAQQKLVDILETATLTEAVNALESVAVASEFDVSTATDFVDDVLAEKLADAGDASGITPNTVLFGSRAWLLRRGTIGAGNNAQNFMAPRDIAGLGAELGVDAYIPTARTADGSTFPTLLGDKVFGFIGSGAGADVISNIKMFTGRGGLKFTSFNHPQGELEILTASRWQGIEVVSTVGAFVVSVSKSK